LLVLLVSTFGLLACGDDDGGGGSGDGDGDAATTTTEAATTTTADPSAEISELYTSFFSFPEGTDYEAKLQMLEDPDAIRDLFNRGLAHPVFQPLLPQVTVRVEEVRVTGEDTAEVDYTLLLNGEPPLPGVQLGRAVLVEGTWTVANSTVCALLALGDPAFNQDPACKVG
jgi:hypothetical protein